MTDLILGADGFIGGELVKRLPMAVKASRRPGMDLQVDLAVPGSLPLCDTVYVCAGVNGAWKCEMSPAAAFAANVDGPIELARRMGMRGTFTVVISSMSVEWTGGTKYQQQKFAAETVLRTMPMVGIVRAGRVTKDNVGSLCETLIRVGNGRVEGVTRWGTDEIAYQK